MKSHPASEAFPMMDNKRFDELKEDIKNSGLKLPIILFDGMILDGRNRMKACIELGITPKTETFTGDPWAYVWSLNGTRRDLVAEQRYLIWKFCSENSEKFQAEKRRIHEEANRKRSEAAKGNANAAKTFVCECGEEFSEKVWHCKKCDHHWPNSETICRNCHNEKTVVVQNVQPLNRQAKTRSASANAANVNAGAVARGDVLASKRPDLAKKVMSGEIKPAEAHRVMKRDEVSENIAKLPEDKFSVIYADPPWKYNDAQAVKGDYGTGTGAANSHYPSMTLSELKALDIPKLAADNAVLWLWATCPLIEDALELCRAWGFKYKAQFVWDKIKHNMGHYNSVRHELLLICTKGSCTPEHVKLFDSVQSIERTQHSKKPEEFREIINTLYPSGKKIELFRRGDAPAGWEVWGNEC